MRTWNAEHGDAMADIDKQPCLAAIWFVVHHFWFLDVQVGGLPVRALCQLLLAALASAVLLPGLIRSAAPKNLISALMLLQVGLASCSADGPSRASLPWAVQRDCKWSSLGPALLECSLGHLPLL